MDLAEKIRRLNISTISEESYEALYHQEHAHLSQGWLLDWHDTHAVVIERAVLVILIGAVFLLLLQLLPFLAFASALNAVLVILVVTASISLVLVAYRYTRLTTKADRHNSGSSISGGFMNDLVWREHISFPDDVYQKAQMIQAAYPELLLSLRSDSLYLLHPGLPITTERNRVIHRVQVSKRDDEEVATIGMWVHKRNT